MSEIKLLQKNITIDERTREYIEKRLGGIEKILDDILRFDVEVEKNKSNMFRVEIMVKTPKDMYRSDEISESVEGSVDMTVEALKSQITRKKDKLLTKAIRGGRSIKKKTSIDEGARF